MGPNVQDLAISSPDIAAGAAIDDRFAAETGNEVPTLSISGAPADAVELAVILHDPDAPLPNGFTHWVVYGVSPDASSLDTDAEGVRVAPNGAGFPIYYGPEPPVGHGLHHYYFWIYALSRPVEGEPSREEFLERYGDAVIEQARFVAVWSR